MAGRTDDGMAAGVATMDDGSLDRPKPRLVAPPLVKAIFVFDKETPGTLRYRERGERGMVAVDYLYLKKAWMQGQVPEALEVTIVALRARPR